MNEYLDGEGHVYLFESGRASAEANVIDASFAHDIATSAGATIEEAFGSIRRLSSKLVEAFEASDKAPSEFTAEFGVKLSASAGVVVSKASSEGHIKITVKWSRQKV